jgi:hypothetical protein
MGGLLFLEYLTWRSGVVRCRLTIEWMRFLMVPS